MQISVAYALNYYAQSEFYGKGFLQTNFLDLWITEAAKLIVITNKIFKYLFISKIIRSFRIFVIFIRIANKP